MSWEVITGISAVGAIPVAIIGVVVLYLVSDDAARNRVRRFFRSAAGVGLSLILAAVMVFGILLLVRPSGGGCGFSDAFEGASLNSKWSRVNLVNGGNNYSVSSGQLTMDAASGVDLFPANGFNAPRILQSVGGNFTVTTTVSLNPVANVLHYSPANSNVTDAYQGAGILIWEDATDFVRLERGYRGIGTDGIYLLAYGGGKVLVDDTSDIDATEVTLKLQRSDNSFVASWSSGSSGFSTIGSVQFPGTDLDVGLLLVNNSGNAPNVADSAVFSSYTISCG